MNQRKMDWKEIQAGIQGLKSYDDVPEDDCIIFVDSCIWMKVDFFLHEKNKTSIENKPKYLFWGKNVRLSGWHGMKH